MVPAWRPAPCLRGCEPRLGAEVRLLVWEQSHVSAIRREGGLTSGTPEALSCARNQVFLVRKGCKGGFGQGEQSYMDGRSRERSTSQSNRPKLPCCPSPILFSQCPLGPRRSPNWLHHPRQGSSHQQCTRKPALLIFLPRPVVHRPGQKVLTGQILLRL